MKIVDYPIIETVPFKENGKVGFRLLVRCKRIHGTKFGYRLEHTHPAEFDIGIELSDDRPSWKRIHLINDLTPNFVRIAAYNHNNIEHGIPDHEILEVHLSQELFSHLEHIQEDSCQLSK